MMHLPIISFQAPSTRNRVMLSEFKQSLTSITLILIHTAAYSLWINHDARVGVDGVGFGFVLWAYIHHGMRWTFCFLERCARALLRMLDIFSLSGIPKKSCLFLAADLSGYHFVTSTSRKNEPILLSGDIILCWRNPSAQWKSLSRKTK